MLDVNVTAENKILIDKLVRSENEIEIMDIVKKLVPEATEFTAMLYARYTEYDRDYEMDQFMDIAKDSDRIKFLDENKIIFREEFFNLIPYMPLTAEERLYKNKYIKATAPKRKNKYLEGMHFSHQEFKELHPVERYIIRAMNYNPDFDWKAAEKFVLEETKKVIEDYRLSKEKKSEEIFEPVEHADFYSHYWAFTSYMKRQNFFARKLFPYMSEEEITNSGYENFLIHLHSETNPNYNLKTSISVDFHFAKMAEDYHNEQMRKKFGDNAEEEIFGKTFMKTLEEVV